MPKRKPAMPEIKLVFAPLQDFWSPETESQYVKGLRYTVRTKDGLLARLVEQWVEQGKVSYVDAKGTMQSVVTGQGTTGDSK